MKIYFFCPRWGSESLSIREFIHKAKQAGYDGAEFSLPLETAEREDILLALKDENFKWIGQHWETATSNFTEHIREYRERLLNQLKGDPVLIDSQTGKDFFSFEQNETLIEAAMEISRESGVEIVHETHRGKFSFAAHITRNFLERIPELRIGADFSHWCNTAESMLENQPEAMDLAISRADHIHARVGFAEGPQIPDPRATEWEEVLAAHMAWWDRIIERARAEGREFFTITPEFGPYPYMTILPHSRKPIADQWDINAYMMKILRERYES